MAQPSTTPSETPEERFSEQLCRIAATGEVPEPSPSEATRADAAQFASMPPAWLYERLTPALCDKRAHVAMQWLRDTGVIAKVLPELDATVAFSQEGGRRHKDVWEHTKIVVWQAVPRPAVRWAAVLHDIGKVPTRRFTSQGRVTFHGHAEVGVRMFRKGPAKRIGFPAEIRQRVEDLIRFHLRPGQYESSWTDAAVRRFAKDMGPALRDALDLSRADITSKRPGRRRHCLRQISELSKRIVALAEADAVPKALPAGLGHALMSELGLPPGKHLGDLRAELEAMCEAGEIERGRDAAYYVQIVADRALHENVEIRVPKNLAARAPAATDTSE